MALYSLHLQTRESEAEVQRTKEGLQQVTMFRVVGVDGEVVEVENWLEDDPSTLSHLWIEIGSSVQSVTNITWREIEILERAK